MNNLTTQWLELTKKLQAMFDIDINIESILFLIGLREIGSSGKQEFSKAQKVDLMHVALCRLLSQSGYYHLSHLDQDGWPHWELVKPLPFTDYYTQTNLLKTHILTYFEEVFEA
ncbi:MAG: hypothetical protein ACKVTZ_15595 [Bacteroidia bacterium]